MEKFKKNLIVAFFAQFISIMTSISISLLLPKILGVGHYAYYQLLIFGVSYIGLLHMGLSDGVYLKLGGKEYAELDYHRLASFFWLMLIWLIVFCIGGNIVVSLFVTDKLRVFVWQMVFIYGIFANESWYLGYIFQATNNTKWYSVSILIFKLIILTVYLFFFFNGEADVKKYITIYVLAQIVSFIYCVVLGYKVFFGLRGITKAHLLDLAYNCKVGLNLTISNVSNTMILGIGRVIVDKKWSLESFGKVSLAISLTNFLMQFMQQISMVLFPALRKASRKYQQELFNAMNNSIGIIICGLYILYYPLEYILNLWLPQYADSFLYLGLLIPICCYDGKVYVLFNTYMKVLRKEKSILWVNLISCGICFILSLLLATLFKSIKAVILAALLTIAFRNYAFGRILSAQKKKYNEVFMTETLLSALFVILQLFAPRALAIIVYSCTYLIVIWVKKDDILSLKCIIQNK